VTRAAASAAGHRWVVALFAAAAVAEVAEVAERRRRRPVWPRPPG
jgi:hypothetical protein